MNSGRAQQLEALEQMQREIQEKMNKSNEEMKKMVQETMPMTMNAGFAQANLTLAS